MLMQQMRDQLKEAELPYDDEFIQKHGGDLSIIKDNLAVLEDGGAQDLIDAFIMKILEGDGDQEMDPHAAPVDSLHAFNGALDAMAADSIAPTPTGDPLPGIETQIRKLDDDVDGAKDALPGTDTQLASVLDIGLDYNLGDRVTAGAPEEFSMGGLQAELFGGKAVGAVAAVPAPKATIAEAAAAVPEEAAAPLAPEMAAPKAAMPTPAALAASAEPPAAKPPPQPPAAPLPTAQPLHQAPAAAAPIMPAAAEAAPAAAAPSMSAAAAAVPEAAGPAHDTPVVRVRHNSVTAPAEWAVFTRQLKNTTAYPQNIKDEAATKQGKFQAFNLWLECNKDPTKLTQKIQLKITARDRGEAVWEWLKPKQMLAFYSPEKVDELKKQRDGSGQYQLDAEFPNDTNERYYLIRTRLANIKSSEQEIEMSMEGVRDLDQDSAKALLSSDGLFGGTMALAGQEGGEKFFGLVPAPAGKPTKDPKNPKGKAQGTAKTSYTLDPADYAMATTMLSDMLNQVSRAERLSTELNAHQLSTDIEKQMTQHAKRVKELWKMGEKLVGLSPETYQQEAFVKVQAKFVVWTAWFDTRYEAGNSLVKKINSKRKAAAKAEADKKKVIEDGDAGKAGHASLSSSSR
ncbi:unnamed protein product [Prorocentrum cordatum]|uniref:Uncharacterized protein n=1 Tax=Prorocentrum cordatum TaxID=2364126 RepID=A0ABN9YBD8_9DINO|nr:unnamed protein product [Polarella glacialis]